MAAINTSEILLELVALGDDLPSSTHATDLHSLLKQLIQATRAERAAAKQAMGDLQIKVEELAAANREHDRPSADATAAKKVTDLQAWHDEAAKQLASVERERDQALRELTEAMKQRDHARLELHTAQDTAVKLRAEVVHLEDIVKKQQQPLAQPADGTRNVVDSPRNGGNIHERRTEAKRDPRLVSVASNTASMNIRAPPSPSAYPVESRSETANHSSRVSIASSSTAGNINRRLPPPAIRSDSYRPLSFSKSRYVTSSGKRKRRSTSPSRRPPPCGTCVKHHRIGKCDGKPRCGHCECMGEDVLCVYHLCREEADCRFRDTCDYLHPDQWDGDAEGDVRVVRKFGGGRVKGRR